MDNTRNVNYLREFFYSKYNGILAGVTIGLGMISGHPFMLIAGIVGYGLGLMFLHDCSWFQNKMSEKYDQIDKLEAYKQVEKFKAMRAKQLEALSLSRKERYINLVSVGKAIEQATAETVSDSENTMDSRLRKIDELIWTFLKLLTIEQSLEVFIESERQDDLPKELKEVEDRLLELAKEIDELKKTVGTNALVLSSKEQAKANIEVVSAEQERLQQQVKLIRADAIATRNTESLTSRIDASLEHLGETNKWISEMNDFKDIVGDMPQNISSRIGFGEDTIDYQNSNLEDKIGVTRSTRSTSRKVRSLY